MGDNFTYKFFTEGFFGYSDKQDFYYFSLAHFAPIILLVLGIFLIYRFREKLRNFKHEDTFRTIVGAIIIFNECAYYWRLLYVGNSQDGTQLITFLPLQVCEWSAYISAFMLIKKNRHLYDVAFYITLSLGLIPLFTPAVIMQAGPGYFRYYQFWIEHTLPILGVFYMTFVHGYRPSFKKIYKPFAVLSLLAVLAIIANLNIEGANFMYLASTTSGDSIANILPPSIPLRLLIGFGIISVLWTLLTIPEFIAIYKARKQKNQSKTE